MQKVAFPVFLILLVLLQLGVFVNVPLMQAVPNLFVVSLIWFSFQNASKRMWATALVGGLFLDLYSYTFFGVNLVTFLVLAQIMEYLTREFLPKESHPYLVIGGVVLSSLFVYFFSLLLLFLLSRIVNAKSIAFSLQGFQTPLLWTVLYNLLILIPFAAWGRRFLKNTT